MADDATMPRLPFSPHDLRALIARGRHLGLTDHALASELHLTAEELDRIARGSESRWLHTLLTEWQERLRPRSAADMDAVLREAAEAAHLEKDHARLADEGGPS